jgi:hypothetical protein
MGFFVKSLVDRSYIYKRWTYAIWTNKKTLPNLYFHPAPKKNLWLHEAMKLRVKLIFDMRISSK